MSNHDDEVCGRTLHVIDLENLAGSPRSTRDEIRTTIEAYCRAVTVRPGDHAVIAMNANHGAMTFTALDEWRDVACCGCVLKVGHGHDGADDALLHACDPGRVAARYDRVVVGSGDHKFADFIVDLRTRGTLVGVVSRRQSLSRSVAKVSPIRRYLDEPSADVA